MAKIENTTVYPLTTPSVDDFIIGTDTSDENRTVSFSIADITATSLLQGLQSVLGESGVATLPITLTGGTGNIVCTDIYPGTITAAGGIGTAGQVLSSTGAGIEWVAASSVSCCSLDDTLAVGNSTTLDIDTTGSINMSGGGTSLAFTGGADITLAASSSITTEDDIILGSASVLNFNATSVINDATGAVGSIGQILTVNAALGVEWSTGVPVASIPTLQQVLTAGDTANSNPMNLTAGSALTLDGTSNIVSAGDNSFTGTNTFSANGTLITTAGVVLSGSLWDGANTGTSGQVLTSTSTGVAWADAGATANTQNLQSVLGYGNTATNDILLTGSVIPTTITDGAASVGTNLQYLSSTGTGLAWVTLPVPTSAVSSVAFSNTNITSLGPPLVISPTVGNVVVEARAYGGGALTGYVPDSGSVTEFLQGDGTWAVPAGGSAPEGYLPYLLGVAKTAFVPGNYHTLASNNTLTGGDRTVFTTVLGASSPAVMAGTMTDLEHIAGCFLYNPRTNACTSAFPNMKVCDFEMQFLSEFGAHDWDIELWKTDQCSTGTYTLAGSHQFSAVAADTLYCGTMVWVSSALQTLLPGEAFFITLRTTGTLTGADATLNIVARWQGAV
jgi:hypothetical protein